jgi:hypothetical protein
MAQPSAQSLETAPLLFPSLSRLPVAIPGSSQSFTAINAFPNAHYRILNASSVRSLVVRADQSVHHADGSDARPQQSGLVAGTRSASVMNTPRFDVRMYEGDVSQDMAIHDVR